MDKFRALETFVAIVDKGSLTAAADAMDSSLPAVVRQLAALEAQVGVRLLNRTTRRLSLTEDGRLYLERVRRILADMDEADRSLLASSTQVDEPSGTVSVTAPVLFGHMHVAPAVARFLQRYPKMRVNLALFDRVVDIVHEGHDLAVRIAHLADSSLVAQPVGKIGLVVAASPDWLRRHGVPRHPRELAKVNCIIGADGRQWNFADEDGKPFSVPVQGNFECNLGAPRLEACAAGLGPSRFQSYQVVQHVRDQRLRVVLQRFQEPARNVSIVYPSARLLPLRTRVFIEWLKSELQATLTQQPQPPQPPQPPQQNSLAGHKLRAGAAQ
ncbi:LysR family transcriptional regulator [Ramlibacter solisilvae]|uniref:LysR family transcriptional regulator n=1 Tax=Ramlibacter tataouinensis TaxID=94132 RepID=UPI0009EE68FC|nr:LysR family transcriptional regulator [Ramlibacter tataouinensis]